ncbi:uncharacterized protein B0P05DRAFT_522604 [Gilbertella persicaria]|uniref:Uncharacterized protein n=1 Tax=Rhizopus stolonifer TaxID=4846 RepID=A0A367KR57_RHIST|nr:uncharacterized protein B0P05DRAFT_522604 [Gilbertella persicaria]KAI8097918.1 hypothetical protein B0P05DRAFT_522604 [Gilbertella persicaria]RCI04676.1 hypothetical protein CU098_006389 [Rhizopus stolonifer]
MDQVHIPILSEDEKIFLNTTATFSQARRMSNTIDHSARPSLEDNISHRNRRHQVASSVPSLSFLWKRRGSSVSAHTTSSAGSVEYRIEESQSPKARELESLIFDQPQRTVRMSLTPRCAV